MLLNPYSFRVTPTQGVDDLAWREEIIGATEGIAFFGSAFEHEGSDKEDLAGFKKVHVYCVYYCFTKIFVLSSTGMTF